MVILKPSASVANFAEIFNQLPLEILETTLPTKPDPPEAIEASPESESSVRIRFNPIYPPTGSLSTIEVHWIEVGLFEQR